MTHPTDAELEEAALERQKEAAEFWEHCAAITEKRAEAAEARLKEAAAIAKKLAKARDDMRRIYRALTTTQAHKMSIQKDLDAAWADFDAFLASLEGDKA